MISLLEPDQILENNKRIQSLAPEKKVFILTARDASQFFLFCVSSMTFVFSSTAIADCILIQPTIFEDKRWFFMETYHADKFAQWWITTTFIQDNHSKSKAGVLRWLHFQTQHSQAKLVRVTRWAVLDIVLDCRVWSPSYEQHIIVELNETNKHQLFIPKGCAHGFLTLVDDTEFLYKCDDVYAPHFDSGIHYASIGADRENIKKTYWLTDFIISPKDQGLQTFEEYKKHPLF